MRTLQIAPPLAFSETGQRKNNEDYFLPPDPSGQHRLFVVCDGMGGLDKGEEASRIVAESVYEFLMADPHEISQELINDAVILAHQKLNAYMDENSLVSRMGSTLTLLCLTENAAVVAHIGDSRVYHIRGGKILYKTRDHKQVQDMVEDGVITEEQALTHPWRNRLSRSVSVEFAAEDGPRHQYDSPHCHVIEDIEPGDYFFLCTDGVLEQVDDRFLSNTLADPAFSNEKKIKAIKEKCGDRTKDNYTGILVQIAEEEETGGEDTQEEDTGRREVIYDGPPGREFSDRGRKPEGKKRALYVVLFLLMIAGVLYYFRADFLLYLKKFLNH